MNKIYIDSRWENYGGIGTFYSEINKINNYEDAKLRGKPMSPFDCLSTTIQLFFRKNGVFFLPGYIPPVFLKNNYIFTIHDLNHLDRPENSSLIKRLFYRTIVRRGCKKAKYVFTVSEFSRKKIIEWANISPEKVINVSNGVSHKFRPEGERSCYDFKYFLCVSNRKGHKNEIGLLEAFKKARIDKNVKLVFTGKKNDFIANKIIELNLEDRIVFTGFVHEDELPKIYRSAIGLVFVSFYEGFGLPVIEAQASGIPVITSNTTALCEIAGNGAILVNPYNKNEISDAIEKIYNNDNNICELLIEAGYINCANYTWSKTAERVDFYINSIK
ncbi:TPA: glycosyltransferase family 4 protein [Klebsiella pneumoniae]|nr:glycosyltransferase family 4 protein [Klebsiella pneumoniae]